MAGLTLGEVDALPEGMRMAALTKWLYEHGAPALGLMVAAAERDAALSRQCSRCDDTRINHDYANRRRRPC